MWRFPSPTQPRVRISPVGYLDSIYLTVSLVRTPEEIHLSSKYYYISSYEGKPWSTPIVHPIVHQAQQMNRTSAPSYWHAFPPIWGSMITYPWVSGCSTEIPNSSAMDDGGLDSNHLRRGKVETPKRKEKKKNKRK